MLARTDQTPALLSFLLPGLGQLFQRHLLASVGFFGVFCGLLVGDLSRWALPLWALLSAFEAMRRKAGAGQRFRVRLYAGVGILGFVCWFGFFAGLFFPRLRT